MFKAPIRSRPVRLSKAQERLAEYRIRPLWDIIVAVRFGLRAARSVATVNISIRTCSGSERSGTKQKLRACIRVWNLLESSL